MKIGGVATTGVEIGDLTVDHLDEALDVRRRSFGPLDAGMHERWRRINTSAIDSGRALAAYNGRRLVGMARIHHFRQWWRGRDVPMAGVAGVVIAPEARGQGVGSRLMAEVLSRTAEHGYPLSVLYPATVPLYRQFGWELAGHQRTVELPARELRAFASSSAPVDVRRCQPGDEEHVESMIATQHERRLDCGPLAFEPREWAEELTDEDFFMYVAEDGFVGYGFSGSDTLAVSHLLAESEATTRGLWRLVGSGSSTVRTVRACVAPDDPLTWLGREVDVKVHKETWWMLRLVDAAAAVTARGFPARLDVDVALSLHDPHRPGNSGPRRFVLTAGCGQLVADSGTTGLALGANGLAALYAGVPTATLRRAGLASGGSRVDDEALDAAFGATAFALDYF